MLFKPFLPVRYLQMLRTLKPVDAVKKIASSIFEMKNKRHLHEEGIDWKHELLEADGLFHCCKCQEVTLMTYNTGHHPFDTLKCECDHIICKECVIDPVFQLISFSESCSMDFGPVKKYGVLCRNCGKTHRTDFRGEPYGDQKLYRWSHFTGVQCDCGFVSDATWLRFQFGHNIDVSRGL